MSLTTARWLAAFAALALNPMATNAQSGIPWCETSQSGSVQAAFQLIQQGDAILNQLSDCAQVNLMACEDALRYYRAAERQIADVFYEAKGEACTWCDITPVGDVASELAIRGDQFTQALGWEVNLRSVWNDYQTWRDAPYCDVPGWQGNAQAGGQQGPLPGPPVNPGAQGCALVGENVGLYLPDANGPDLQNIGPEQCRQVCEDNSWCRSFTANLAAQACQFHEQTYREVPLQNAFNNQIVHYTCLGR